MADPYGLVGAEFGEQVLDVELAVCGRDAREGQIHLAQAVAVGGVGVHRLGVTGHGPVVAEVGFSGFGGPSCHGWKDDLEYGIGAECERLNYLVRAVDGEAADLDLVEGGVGG